MLRVLTVTFIVQILLLRYIISGETGINLFLIVTIEMALIKGSLYGEVTGFITGLIEDVAHMGVIGSRALIRTLVGFLTGSLKGKFAAGNILFQFIVTFIVFVVHGIFIYLLRLVFGLPPSSLHRLFMNAGLNGLIAPLIYSLLKGTDAG
ncbi:MAG: rod shape-determining protein MreD [Elusimicrobiota bacterium]